MTNGAVELEIAMLAPRSTAEIHASRKRCCSARPNARPVWELTDELADKGSQGGSQYTKSPFRLEQLQLQNPNSKAAQLKTAPQLGLGFRACNTVRAAGSMGSTGASNLNL